MAAKSGCTFHWPLKSLVFAVVMAVVISHDLRSRPRTVHDGSHAHRANSTMGLPRTIYCAMKRCFGDTPQTLTHNVSRHSRISALHYPPSAPPMGHIHLGRTRARHGVAPPKDLLCSLQCLARSRLPTTRCDAEPTSSRTHRAVPSHLEMQVWTSL